MVLRPHPSLIVESSPAILEIGLAQSYIRYEVATMLCLSKKTEYALAALAYLAERSHRVSSAREIAEAPTCPCRC